MSHEHSHDHGHSHSSSRQATVFTNWINAKVAGRGLRIEDIYEDLKNGIVLYNLLEELAHQSLAPLGRLTTGATQIHRNVNMSIVFRYLNQTIKMVGIGPADIVEGNPSLTLGLIWSIIVFFSVKDIGDVVDLKAFKSKVLKWVQRLTEPYTDVAVTNFTTSLADGHALNAILNRVAPSKFKYSHKPTAAENLERAFSFANAEFGVAQLLDPNDPNCCEDEKSMLTYLAEMMQKLPHPPDEHSAEVVASIIDNLQRSPSERVDFFMSNASPSILSDLQAVCSVPSIPSDVAACGSYAATVDRILQEKGLPSVVTIPPAYESEDPSGVGSPFLLFTSTSPVPERPVILVYNHYGVDSSAASDPAWATSPFECVTVDNRVFVPGSSSGKADLVASIQAVQSLVQACDEDTPATICVLSGPTLSAAGNGAVDQKLIGMKLQEFLTAHSEIGKPDVVLIADNGSTFTPGLQAVKYGVKGEAGVTISVQLFEDGRSASDSIYGTVIADAAQVLTAAINSLRDHSTGGISASLPRVQVPDITRASLAENVNFSAYDLKNATGYLGEVTVPSVAEAVCFGGGFSITSFRYDAPSGSLGPTATARLLISVPPGLDAANFLAAVEELLTKSVPHGASITFSDRVHVSGWLLDPENSVLPLVKDAVGSTNGPNASFCSSSPVFDPISTAFKLAFPDAQVFMVGSHDPAAHPNRANENISIPDVVKRATATAKIILALKDVAFVHASDAGVTAEETKDLAEPAGEVDVAAANDALLIEETSYTQEVVAQEEVSAAAMEEAAFPEEVATTETTTEYVEPTVEAVEEPAVAAGEQEPDYDNMY